MLKSTKNNVTNSNKIKIWNLALSFVSLSILILYLIWKLSALITLSTQLETQNKMISHFHRADKNVLGMMSSITSYALTNREGFEQDYQKDKLKLIDELKLLELLTRGTSAHGVLKSIEYDLEGYPSSMHLITIRKKINRLISLERLERDERVAKYKDEGMRLSIGSVVATLLVSLNFFIYWRRVRKWTLGQQIREEKFKQMAINSVIAEQRFRGLLESAHDLILIIDTDAKILYVNNQLAQTFGYDKDELVGNEIEMLVPDRYRELHKTQRNTYLKSPEARTMAAGIDLNGKKKDGKEIPVEITLSPFKVEGKLQVAAIIRDISERKHEEKKQKWLNELGNVLSQTLDTNDIMINFAKFSLCRFADWSAIVCKSGKYMMLRSEYENSERWEEGTKELSEGIFKLLPDKQAFLKHNVSQNDLFELPITHGHKVMILETGVKSIIISPLLGRDELIGVVVIGNSTKNYTMEDFSYIQNLIARVSLSLDNAYLYQLSQGSVRMRDEFLRIVSHDLKNPLNSIKLSVQLVQRMLQKMQLGKEDEVMKRISTIEKSTDYSVKLIKDLLDNAQLETGGFNLNKDDLIVTTLVTEVHNLFQALAEEKEISFLTNIKVSKNLRVKGDHERLMQLISNLLGNAFKFTPQGGKVELSVIVVGREMVFSITDNGPGISKEKHAHLFEKYWRDTESGAHSLGLGLSIAKSIVEAHGGKIWIESNEGKGTKVSFALQIDAHPDERKGV